MRRKRCPLCRQKISPSLARRVARKQAHARSRKRKRNPPLLFAPAELLLDPANTALGIWI